jgi:hypothetical protein
VTRSILPLSVQLVALALLVLFSGWVIRLIRTQRLQLRESLIWLLTTLLAMVVTAFPQILVWAAALLGVQVPSNALFAAGLLYLAVNVLSVTIAVSGNTAKVRRLAQECALLRAEIEELRAATGVRPPPRRDAGETSARR